MEGGWKRSGGCCARNIFHSDYVNCGFIDPAVTGCSLDTRGDSDCLPPLILSIIIRTLTHCMAYCYGPLLPRVA